MMHVLHVVISKQIKCVWNRVQAGVSINKFATPGGDCLPYTQKFGAVHVYRALIPMQQAHTNAPNARQPSTALTHYFLKLTGSQ